jgi:hypothetical protein
MIIKKPAIPIKQWLVARLQAYAYIDVYDGMTPTDADGEYIVISSRTANQGEGKDCFQFEVSANVDIVTKGSNFGFKRAEQIAELVVGGINSDTVVTLPVGWDCKNVVCESINNLEDLDPFENTFRVIIRYTFVITQTI